MQMSLRMYQTLSGQMQVGQMEIFQRYWKLRQTPMVVGQNQTLARYQTLIAH
jgi:hypothetical protein